MSDSPFSLYIHIPFCTRKCAYCSFTVIAGAGKSFSHALKDHYTQALLREILSSADLYSQRPLYTIYIGGGTPTLLGAERLIMIIDTLWSVYDMSILQELTIECNPDMGEDVLETIQTLQHRYPSIARIRRSIGIQTWDQEILQASGRGYDSHALQNFITHLIDVKQDHTIYNMDMIAFGKLQQGLPRSETERLYWAELVASHLFQHCSLYTLELFEGSQRYHELTHQKNSDQMRYTLGYGLKKYGDDQAVYQEFDYLMQALHKAGYHRYELSNFALPDYESLHNQVYRHYGDYLGLGLGSSSKIGSQRRSNTKILKPYLQDCYKDEQTLQILTRQDQLTEHFFLALRTRSGIEDIRIYQEILESDYHHKLMDYHQSGYVYYADHALSLTDAGMNVYNYLITELLHAV